MGETLRDVIGRSGDLFIFQINKNNDFDRTTWDFKVTDKNSELFGMSDKLCSRDYRIVTLRRGDHFFIAYKMQIPSGKKVYFVDVRKSNHKTSVRKYIDSLVNFYMKSNDISYRKDDSSFKVSQIKMRSLGIGNYVDLCHYFREYSAVGIGLTRDVRNLIVLDIDVDCRIPENRAELERILVLFGENGMIPDFEIHNNTNGHIQLQWLIQSHQYKKKCETQIDELVSKLESDKNRNREVGNIMVNCNFTEDTEGSDEYRFLTKSLTCVSDKPKFGDKNFTFWKAKNFCTALYRLQNLELKMPRYKDGKITYLSQDEMVDMFSTKEKRKEYFDKAPEFSEIFSKSTPFLTEYCTDSDRDDFDEDDETLTLDTDREYVRDEMCEDSRNNFVFGRTKTVTWDICREMNLKSAEDIAKLPKPEIRKLENTVHKKVKEEYNRLDSKYGGGRWPGTSNSKPFSVKEFESAFQMAFNFAKCKFNNISKYSDEQREKSRNERGLKKDMKLVLVDYFRNKDKDIKREDLLKTVNKTLEKSGQKKISLSSLKRYIAISKSMGDEERKELYSYYYENFKKRQSVLSDTQQDDINSKKRKKKKLDYISINIVEDIMKNTSL